MNDLKKKSDKTLMILSALGILFVIDGHVGVPMSAGTKIFPYDSFFMPMFIFISGYFYNNRHAETFKSSIIFIKNKFMRLMVPYILWAVFYGFLVMFLSKADLMFWSATTFHSLPENILSTGTTFDVNGAAWFIPTLFFTASCYVLMRKFFSRFWNDYAGMVLLAAVGCISLYFCRKGYNLQGKYLLLLKIGFFIQFFHFGFLFRQHLDSWFKAQNTFLICSVMILVNAVILTRVPDINFYSCAFMNSFHNENLLLPLITSVTGILFWFKISQALTPILGDSKLVNYISNHTFFIMENHLLFKNILYFIFFLLGHKLGMQTFADFDVEAFRNSSWYFYGPNYGTCILSFMFCLFGTLLACAAFYGLINLVRRKFAPRSATPVHQESL